jgi:hypothetical protein
MICYTLGLRNIARLIRAPAASGTVVAMISRVGNLVEFVP